MPSHLNKPFSQEKKSGLRGRGVSANPKNRFKKLELEWEELSEESPRHCQFYADQTQSVLSQNESPDVPFRFSLNPYRGCEHGCAYCYARPTHEYLGFSGGLDFETKILVKTNAPALLRKRLAAKSWVPQPIALSGVTDPYQPVEKKLKITRQCLEVLEEAGNPVVIITKNYGVTRDIDILRKLAEHKGALVFISLTTLDESLRRRLEPRTSTPSLRLDAIQKLSRAGIPVGVLLAPIIPGLTDSEVPALLKAAAKHGAKRADYVMLRLPYGVSALFSDWLERHCPEKKNKVLHQIQTVRKGKLYDSVFEQRMTGSGLLARQINKLFEVSCRRLGLNQIDFPLSTSNFKRPINQLSLFSEN